MYGGDPRVEGVVLEKSGDLGNTETAMAAPVAAHAPMGAAAAGGDVLSAFGGRVVE
jgi:hypothetical protein